MTFIQAIIFGAVQGVTEFLPISSSGHLVILQKMFSLKEPPIFFDTLIHLATMLAVVFYLRKEILHILKNIKTNLKLIGSLFLATIPAVVVGFLLKDKIEEIFSSLQLLGASFLITAIILYSTKFFKSGTKNILEIGWLKSLFVGCFQALAILPGVSRSGSTISAGLFTGMKRDEAFKFSFLLAIPVILGAMVLQIFEFVPNSLNGGILPNITGFLFASVFGFFSLKILEKIAVKGKLHLFAYYCLALSLIIFFI